MVRRLLVPERNIGAPLIQRQRNLEKDDPVIVTFTDTEGPEDFDAVIEDVEDSGNRYRVHYVEAMLNGNLPAVYDERHVRLRKTALPVRVIAKGREYSGPIWGDPYLDLPPDIAGAVNKEAGDAKKISDLTESQVESLVALLSRVQNPKGSVTRLKNSLALDLERLQHSKESPEQVLEREHRVNAEIRELENNAFATQFGSRPEDVTLSGIRTEVDAWFRRVKKDELSVGFQAAYRANRMTVRQINFEKGLGRSAVSFPVKKHGRPSDPTDRTMNLDPSPQGIAKRLDPANFLDQQTVNQQGVHELSASVLRGDANQDISGQLKFYVMAALVFMPLPEERDLQIFSALNRVVAMDPKVVNLIARMMTRPLYAQASDMHTTYQDMAPGPGGEGQFVYGNVGTVLRQVGNEKRNLTMNNADLAERRKGALEYTKVAATVLTKANEIVMAYRYHQSSKFPLFALWDADHKEFIEVRPFPATVDDPNILQPTGHFITNKGEYH